MSAFQVADRVRVVATSQTGSVAEVGELVAVLLDGSPFVDGYAPEELELDASPLPETPPVVQLAREGLPGVGDALLGLAGAIGELMPDNPVVQAKYAELKAAVESAMPAGEVRDEQGNGWARCGPGCDLAVVRPGKVQCSGAGGCTR